MQPVTDANAAAQPIVMIIDDDDLIRGAMNSLFRSIGLRTATFDSAQAFLDDKLPDAPSCLVVDVRMPKMSGLDLQNELISRGIRIPVIMMTGHGDIPMTVRAMKAGAVDFLAKPFRDQDIIDAVTAALARDDKRRQSETGLAGIRDKFETLTPRERQVMSLVTSGLMNKQVAGELGLSEITVKLHRANAMKKMGARTLADLVRMSESLRDDAND
jgi:FixJ family two-component response regulator